MENTQLFVVAHYFAQPTMGNKVNDALRMLAEATRQEPEIISYEFFRSTEDGDRFVILETYRCAEGLELHRQTEHFQRIGTGIIAPMLARKEVKSFHIHPDEPRG
ncbi:putative quinol monooxygenase [Citrobacter freundii complex sp. 2025EL-00176]